MNCQAILAFYQQNNGCNGSTACTIKTVNHCRRLFKCVMLFSDCLLPDGGNQIICMISLKWAIFTSLKSWNFLVQIQRPRSVFLCQLNKIFGHIAKQLLSDLELVTNQNCRTQAREVHQHFCRFWIRLILLTLWIYNQPVFLCCCLLVLFTVGLCGLRSALCYICPLST